MKYQGVPIEQITIFRHPLIYFELLMYVIQEYLTLTFNFMIKQFLLVIIITTAVLTLFYLPALEV